MIKDLVSIVIPNWNGRKFLAVCLDSLLSQTYKYVEIIVVDNGSVDDSCQFVKQTYPSVKLIALPKNTGFSVAVNKGIKASEGEFLALVNNDTSAHPLWLEKMIEGLREHAEVGSAACKMLSLENKKILDGAGDGLRRGGLPGRIGHGQIDEGQYDQERYVLGACGGAAVYRRAMLDDIGLFDEDFFAYLEDVDLALRSQSAGYRCLYIPGAIMYHLGCGTTGSGYSNLVVRLSCRNNINMMLKNIPFALLLQFLPHIIFWQTYYLAAVLLRGGSLLAWLAGVGEAIMLVPQMLKKRYLINKKRRISNARLRQIIMNSEAELRSAKQLLHHQIRSQKISSAV